MAAKLTLVSPPDATILNPLVTGGSRWISRPPCVMIQPFSQLLPSQVVPSAEVTWLSMPADDKREKQKQTNIG